MMPERVCLNYCVVNSTFDIIDIQSGTCLFYGTSSQVMNWLDLNGYCPISLTEWRLA